MIMCLYYYFYRYYYYFVSLLLLFYYFYFYIMILCFQIYIIILCFTYYLFSYSCALFHYIIRGTEYFLQVDLSGRFHTALPFLAHSLGDWTLHHGHIRQTLHHQRSYKRPTLVIVLSMLLIHREVGVITKNRNSRSFKNVFAYFVNSLPRLEGVGVLHVAL